MPREKVLIIKKWAGPLLLLTMTTYMLFISWGKWADVLIDSGRELYLPWQISKGKVLYRDLFHLFGPFSQYVNAIIFKIFGAKLITLTAFNLMLSTCLMLLIYRVFALLTNPIAAISACATFISIFAFSSYEITGGYNFILPYSHELTHGVILSFLSIYIFILHIQKKIRGGFFILGIISGLIAMTKVEVTAAHFASILPGLILLLWRSEVSTTQRLRGMTIFFAGFSVAPFLFLLFFSRHMSLVEALYAIVSPYTYLFDPALTSSFFSDLIFGFSQTGANLNKMAAVSLWYLPFPVFFLATGYVVRHSQRTLWNQTFIISIILCEAFYSTLVIDKVGFFNLLRPLPIVVFAISLYMFVRVIRTSEMESLNNALPLFVFSSFSFLLLLKMILFVNPSHYGFVLAMPSTLALVALIIYYVPRFFAHHFGKEIYFVLLAIVPLVFLLGVHMNTSREVYSYKTYALSEGGDRFYTFGEKIRQEGIKGHVIEKARQLIEELLKDDETFVVLPEGVMLNYLTRHDNPVKYFEFIPPMVAVPGERHIIEALKMNKPDYVIILDRETREYGFRFFGRHYAKELFQWIRTNYTPVERIGSEPLTGSGFGVLIAKKIVN